MKVLFSLFIALSSFTLSIPATAATQWKLVVNDFVAPGIPFKQYPLTGKETFSQIRLQVMASDLRITNAFVMGTNGTWPLFQLNRDYRSGSVVEMGFQPTLVQFLRFDLQPLGNRPANVMIWMR